MQVDYRAMTEKPTLKTDPAHPKQRAKATRLDRKCRQIAEMARANGVNVRYMGDGIFNLNGNAITLEELEKYDPQGTRDNQIQTLTALGHSARAVAKILDIHRNTVKRVLNQKQP